ncbi:DUF2460 domain-containing protein [Undibacterium sp. RTI2.1]|uniref:DUF2460 domain-containing protein n=1 Tax=unclassified Undibacterium TaxID=2630295 RepID=UPI002AB42018|nr:MULTISPECIES: DUF2460 domain-containing protein [unclassified Undibacterium]MDY7537680.1 DUF2460 domain-containing protein [Undibacterium sp. 5I1]MEB0029282.1 DUF2460 domain-containing protein [Undibacterium sp. RTI2.1]MEB0115590.1 DUF2460 domain-containing protein [Undibacterium sp. RTI2.2]MEB0256417.1 DUF2460 domain-containing protein [Undibacterium sp. 5I1]
MSNAVFPTLAGLAWGNTKKPQFSTRIQRSVNGRELRTSLMSSPLMTFTLKHEFLRDRNVNDDLRLIQGFFMTCQGSYDSFLYTDITDSTVTNQVIGLGDGARTQFQLLRAYGGFLDPVMNVNAITDVKLNGTATASYGIDTFGMITFVTPPAAGVSVTWTGSYYYRCRFVDDGAEFGGLMNKVWELRTIAFVGSLGGKI